MVLLIAPFVVFRGLPFEEIFSKAVWTVALFDGSRCLPYEETFSRSLVLAVLD